MLGHHSPCPHLSRPGQKQLLGGGTGDCSEGFPGGEKEPLTPHTQCWVPTALLEDFQGDGGVLDGHDHTAVVQVEDVMFLLKYLQKTADGGLRAGP